MKNTPTIDGRGQRSEQTRAALLAAGADAFAAHGYGGTRLAAICDAAGANRASVSYHFGGKRALYDAVLAASGNRFDALFDELIALGPVQDLPTFMTLLWSRVRAESTHAKIVMRAVLDDGRPPDGVVWMRQARLSAACEMLGPTLGLPPPALRMAILSMNLLISRYSIVDDSELMALTDSETIEEAHTRLVAHLVEFFRGFIALDRTAI